MTTLPSPSPSPHQTSLQTLHQEFYPYGASVLIAFGVCMLGICIIWAMDKSYEAKEFALNLAVWLWGSWWTVVFWPFQMLMKVDQVLNRGLGRDADGRAREMREEC